jgi:Flp pilus assembly protein TadG
MEWRRLGRQRGQALTEFALILPVLAVILFGLTDIGLAINDMITITNAARDGARVAALNNGSQSEVNSAVTSDETAGSTSLVNCTAATPTLTETTNASPPPTYSSYTVTTSCTYSPITPLGALFKLVGSTGNSPFTISASNTMKDNGCQPPCH